MTSKELLQKYEFKDIDELDEFLMEHIPMIYENGKWIVAQEWKDERARAQYESALLAELFNRCKQKSKEEKENETIGNN